MGETVEPRKAFISSHATMVKILTFNYINANIFTMFNRVKSYILESYSELKRVNWPTKDETIRMTLVVIAMSLIMAVFLGSLDFYLGIY